MNMARYGVWLLMLLSLNAVGQQKNLPDQKISNAITDELWVDQGLSSNNIDVKTQDGIVTLSGSVERLLEKNRAEELAKATVGVRAVVNRIAVKPGITRSDAELAKAVGAAILYDPATESYEVAETAHNGIVMLTGRVGSFAEKQLCTAVAEAVKGVKGVQNDIMVRYKKHRPDVEIQSEVKERIADDVRIDDNLVTVEVQDGTVMLSGAVGSALEKERAETDAWVAGVKKVDSKGLDVRWWARDAMRRDSTLVHRPDQEIRDAVQRSFLYDPRVFSFEPLVQVSGGTVTLNGVVGNLAAKNAAENDARNTVGVRRVENNLKVRPIVPSNKDLHNEVSSAEARDPYIDRYHLRIDADNGNVYLSGHVNTSFEKMRAGAVASNVKGVVNVVNNIDFDYRWSWKSDREIKDEVRRQLFWSPYVDSDDITVTVNNGVVTLTGVVHSWAERDAAERNAYEGGAKDVNDDLIASTRMMGPYGPYYYAWPPYDFIPQ